MRFIASLALIILGVFFFQAPASAQLVADLPGLQMFSDATYNSKSDEYFVTVTGGGNACGARIGPDGAVRSIMHIGDSAASNNYNQSAIAYNPGSNTYLAVLRQDDPSTISVRYLAKNGAPLTSSAIVTSKGGEPGAFYNSSLNYYLVNWNVGYGDTHYRVIDGQWYEPPNLGSHTLVGTGFVGRASYNTTTGQFLYVYAVESNIGNQSHIYGSLLNSDASPAGGLVIADTGFDETRPEVAYAPSSNQWLVIWQKYTNTARTFDIQAAFVDTAGNVGPKFFVAQESGWETPGNVGYDPVTDRFYVTYFLNTGTYIKSVNPHDGTVGSVIPGNSVQAVHRNDGPMALAMRPDPDDPQALIIWREGYGSSGVNGTIISLKTGARTQVTGGGSSCESLSPELDLPPAEPPPPPPPTPTPTPVPAEPTLTIDGLASSAKKQLRDFGFVGLAFTSSGTVERRVRHPNGSESLLSPALPADIGGQLAWSFSPVCQSPPGNYTVWAVDKATGKRSNDVTETVTSEPYCKLPNGSVRPSQVGLTEGNLIGALGSGDPDIFIINDYGYKRLFLNPVIFGFYGHLGGFSNVRPVTTATRDQFVTSNLYRNCETQSSTVYALRVTGGDTGTLHEIDALAIATVSSRDPSFYNRVFCINNNEFDWYPKGLPYADFSGLIQ